MKLRPRAERCNPLIEMENAKILGAVGKLMKLEINVDVN